MQAVRRLLAAPLFTVFAVVTLALGIGGTTAIYAVTEAVLFRPLGIRDADRVVNIYHHDPSRVGAGHLIALSWPDAEDIRQSQTTLSELMLWSRFQVPLTGRGTFTPVLGELVSGNYFTFVGATPLLGRTLQPRDDTPGAPAVVVISERLWQSTFDGDPSIVGQFINIGHESCEVVGVMPASFRGVDMPNVMPTRVWAPLALAFRLGTLSDDADWSDRERRWVLAKGRLADGKSLADARMEIEGIGRRLDASVPIGSDERRPYGRPEDNRFFAVTRAVDLRAHESVDPIAVPMAQAVLVAVVLVLLVACTNLANLILARGTRRQHEVAVRRALGATRAQVVATLAADSVVVAIVGGLGGLVVARGLISILSGSLPVGTGGLSITVEPRMTSAVLGTGLAATAAAAVVFALIPAWHATKAGLRQLLDAQSGGSVARWRGRRWLIAAQVSVSMALLVPGALLLAEAVGKTRHDPGFDLDSLVAAEVDFPLADRGAPMDGVDRDALGLRRVEMMVDAVDRIRRVPGIDEATLVSRLPIYFNGSGAVRAGTEPARPEDANRITAESLRRVAYVTVGDAELFEALGVRIVSGRGFDVPEAESDAPVVVISRALALAVYGSDAAVGRTIFLGVDPFEVVGVADDTDWSSIGRRTYASVYRPGRPDPARPMVLAARAAADPDAAMREIRTVLRDIDPNLPVVEMVTGAMITRQQTLFDRIGAQVVTVLGGFALILALTGLTGLLSFVVVNRRREIGVRLALGADRSRIVSLVVWDGLRPVLYGAALGLTAGAGLSYLLRGYFYRLPGLDWFGLVAVAALVLPAAAAACYLPARRAASVDANVTLREQ